MGAFSNKTVALIGCGALGSRLAPILRQQGAIVHGFRRNASQLPDGIIAHAMDVHQPSSLGALKANAWDYVVISLSPDAFTSEAYQQTYVQGLKNILASLNTARLECLLWISSTSVYAQDDDSWVDELSPTEPESFSGPAQLAAEQLLNPWPQASIIRVAGIYRSERYRLAERVQQGLISATIEPDSYSNRIHLDDCVGVIAHLFRYSQTHALEKCYLACDHEPVRYSVLLNWLAEQLGVPLNDGKPSAIARASSKRCSNQRLLNTGYDFLHPDFRSGLKRLFE